MSNPLTLVLAWIVGQVLGAFFFGGLWWTVRRLVSAKQPALLMMGSLLLRTSVTLVGFFVVSAGHADRMLVCLVGFVMARVLVTRVTRPSESSVSRANEANYAP